MEQWDNVTAELTNLQGEDVQPEITYTEGTARNVVPFGEEGPYNKQAVELSDDNYTLFQNNITLTGDKVETFQHEFVITKAPLLVRGSGWIIYGEEAKDVKDENGDFGANMVYVTTDHPEGDKEMLLGDDTAADQLAGEAVFSSSDYNQFDDISTAEKTYTVTLDGYEPTRNYNVSYGIDTLTVYPKTAELAWFDENDELIEEVDPEYTYDGNTHGVVAKVVNTENEDVVIGKTYEGNDEKDANVKTETEAYTATVTELDNINYTLLKDPKPYTEGKVDPIEGVVDETVIDGTMQDYIINPLQVELSWQYDEVIYNGKNWDNRATVNNLVKGDAYPLTVENAIEKNAGDYEAIIVEESDKNYTLQGVDEALLTHEWTIKPLPVELTWSDGNKVYNGKDQKVTATISNLYKGDTCTLTYKDNVKKDAAKYTAEVTGLSNPNYTLTSGKGLKSTWKISPLPVELTWNKSSLTYNAKDQSVKATIANLVKGDKVTLTYSGNTGKNVGSYTAKATAVDNTNYTLKSGKNVSHKWKIVAASIKKAKVTGITASMAYTGKKITQKPVVKMTLGGTEVTLKAKRDYTVTYKDNKYLGTATITFTGVGNFKDTLNKTFKIQLNGNYKLKSAKNGNFMWDITDGSKKNNANLQLYKNNGTVAQQFKITPSGKYYTIVNVGSKKALQVQGTAGKRANVVQYTANGSKEQLWKVIQNSDGSMSFQPVSNSKYVIDMEDGNVANKTNLSLWTSNATKAQKWIPVWL